LLQQNPWQYYGRNFLSPPEELQDKGIIAKPTYGERVAGLAGFRTKELKPKAQADELKKRMKQILEP
jgi:hypothetical protein